MVHSEIKTVKTDTFEIDCFHFGTGKRTFIIIPGISMTSVMNSADAIADGFADFTDCYTVYVFDHEKNIGADYSVPHTAEHIAEAMELLGLRSADIFGTSQGGMVGQYLAIHHPALVHALYLGCSLSRQNETSLATLGKWMELAKGDDVEALNHCINTTVYSAEFYQRFFSIFAQTEKVGTRADMDRFYWLAKSARDFDCYEELDKIQCPVFATGSFRDNVLGGIGAIETALRLRCDLHMYAGYGHAAYDEHAGYRPRMMRCLNELDLGEA